MQLVYGAWSSEHWNVLGSSAVNSNVASREVVVAGGVEVKLESGGSRSTTQLQIAGVGSTLSAASVARTA